MKRLVIFGILIIISNIISPIKGQTYSYYQTTQSYEREGYTYQCDVPPYKLVTLYNKENTLTYEKIVYKSTQKVFDQEYFDIPKLWKTMILCARRHGISSTMPLLEKKLESSTMKD